MFSCFALGERQKSGEDDLQRLDDKVCVITGAGSGIGRARAAMFAREGDTVVVTDLRAAAAEEVANGITNAGGRAIALAIDGGEESALQRMVDTNIAEYGRIDVRSEEHTSELQSLMRIS